MGNACERPKPLEMPKEMLFEDEEVVEIEEL